MKIKTILALLSAVFIIMVVVIGLVMFWAFGLINREIMHYNDVNRIHKGVSELSMVTHEYFIYRENRMLEQWLLKYGSVTGMLEEMGEDAAHPEHTVILKRIISEHESLGNLFSQLQANTTKRKRLIRENKPKRETDVVLLLEERVMAHALVSIQRIKTEVMKFSAVMQKSVLRVQQRAGSTIFTCRLGTERVIAPRTIPPSRPKGTRRRVSCSIKGASSRESAFTITIPSPGRARTSSHFSFATALISPNPSRCVFPTMVRIAI